MLASLILGLAIFAFTFFCGIKYLFLLDTALTPLVRSEKNAITAVRDIDVIRTLQSQYASKHQGKFAPDFDELIKSAQLDEKFTGKNPIVSGYIFKMIVQEPSGMQSAFYSVTADPIDDSNSYFRENRHFYFDSTIRTIKITEENRPANADDSSI